MSEDQISRRGLLMGIAGAVALPARAQRRPDVPFVTSPMPVVEAMLDLAVVKAGERLIDLGAGDGRIVLSAARRGAEALGVEIDGALIDRARRRAELEGLQAKARFARGDLFQAAIRDADVVTIYLLTSVNQRLRPKLLTELRPGARVVSHAFDMGEWMPDGQRIVEDKQLYLWIIPAVVGGRWRLTTANGRSRTVAIDQRYQRLTGNVEGEPLAASIRGDRLFLRTGGTVFQGIVGDRTIAPDPAFPDAARGWRAERAD